MFCICDLYNTISTCMIGIIKIVQSVNSYEERNYNNRCRIYYNNNDNDFPSVQLILSITCISGWKNLRRVYLHLYECHT